MSEASVFKSNLVKSFEKNAIGRDFVLGDIHGAFDSVVQRMREVDFNVKTDRLFCCGDLIDRGPDSARVVKFLAQSYVHAVRGNHDHEFATLSIEAIRICAEQDFNGMGWAKSIPDDAIEKIKSVFSALPVVIEIETERGKVGIVHADVPRAMNWCEFKALIEKRDQGTLEIALWERDRLLLQDSQAVKGVDRIFVGHSIQWSGGTRLGNIHYIDSGAIFKELEGGRGYLTIANIACSSTVLAVGKATGQKRGVFPDSAGGNFSDYSSIG